MSRTKPHPNEGQQHAEDGRDGEWTRLKLGTHGLQIFRSLKREQRQQPPSPHKEKTK